jgi:hypothetical protein
VLVISFSEFKRDGQHIDYHNGRHMGLGSFTDLSLESNTILNLANCLLIFHCSILLVDKGKWW